MAHDDPPALAGRRLLLAASCTLLLGAGACGEDPPSITPGPEVAGGAVGPDAPVGKDLELLQVQLEYPLDGAYEAGEDARLFFGIANTGTTADTLVDVSGPDFADARTPGGGSDLALEVAAEDNVYVGAEGVPVVVLDDLQTELRSSQSIPVTFTFERAGEVTLDAVVAAEGQQPLSPDDFRDPAEDPTTG